jgi:hypothetical protein
MGAVYNGRVSGHGSSRDAIQISKEATPGGVGSPRVAFEHLETPVRY